MYGKQGFCNTGNHKFNDIVRADIEKIYNNDFSKLKIKH